MNYFDQSNDKDKLGRFSFPMKKFIYEHTIIFLSILFFLNVICLMWYINDKQEKLIKSIVLDDAIEHIVTLQKFRSIYSSEVVTVALKNGLEVTHDYRQKENAIPLPVTLTKMLGDFRNNNGNRTVTRLYSPYPFPWNEKENALSDEFEKESWNVLVKNPETAFYKFEIHDDIKSLRYSTADIMLQSCVDCHNSYPESPKTDWKVGDVRGVLEVIIPLEEATEQAKSAMAEIFLLLIFLSVAGLTGITIMIGKLKRTAEEMKISAESERAANKLTEEIKSRLEAILTASLDPVITIDQFGIIKLASNSVKNVFGWMPEEIIGKNVKTLMPNPHQSAHDGYLKTYRETGVSKLLNTPRALTAVRKDGTIFPCEVSLSKVELKDSDEKLFTATIKDITEREKAEEQLRFTQFTNDHAVDAIFWVKSDARFIYVNESACRMSEYSKEELLSLHNWEFVSGFNERNWKQLWIKIKKKKHLILEGIGKTKSGKLVPIELQLNYLLFNGEEYNIAFIRDITERKKAEKESIKRKKIESFALLAGGVAHDLNNTLGPLVGYPELILRKLPDDSPVRKQVRLMEKSAKDAASVIQDLLTLARRGRYELVPVAMNDLVNDYLATPGFQKEISENPDLKIVMNLSDKLAVINGSAPHLDKVIMNLIINAIDAMSGKGTLTITTEVKVIDKLISGYENIVKGEYVVLRVEDTGVGIPEKRIEKIFEPYYSSKKMQNRSGSGLGLSVVYGVVKDHNGYYDVISEVGRGTEFIIYFPSSNGKQVIEDETIMTRGGSESVLVIDDDDNQRELAREMLLTLGYKVTTAANFKDALSSCQECNPELVVLDMILSEDYDGLDIYKEMLLINPNQKAIIVSGFSETKRVLEAMDLGVGAYVKKPYDLKTIGKAIRAELDKKVITTPEHQKI